MQLCSLMDGHTTSFRGQPHHIPALQGVSLAAVGFGGADTTADLLRGPCDLQAAAAASSGDANGGGMCAACRCKCAASDLVAGEPLRYCLGTCCRSGWGEDGRPYGRHVDTCLRGMRNPFVFSAPTPSFPPW